MKIMRQDEEASWKDRKQARIHGNPVADGWAGAVMQQVAQGQYMVSDTLCPALSDCELELGEAGQWLRRGASSVEHRGTFIFPSILPV